MQKELRVVADTNIFFECMKPEDLPWGELPGDPVAVLLTKPVLDEIDKHKKANGRTRDRALEVFKRVRGILEGGMDEVEICAAGPRVVLRLVPNTPVDPDLAGALDYSKNDDRLIGILSTLHKAGGSPVMLLTHDTGPASSASGFGLSFQLVRDHWLRPPQQTEDQKAKAALKAELARYKTQEPRIIGELLEPQSNPVSITRHRDVALSNEQIEVALAAL
ncbi:MAG: PIN domain-containing protein [Paracoccaceae bacterium]